MNQLTLRGFDDELARRIRALAEREEISLNQAAVRLLRVGARLTAGGDQPEGGRVGNSLDRWIGTWTEADAQALERATRDFEQIDESLWR